MTLGKYLSIQINCHFIVKFFSLLFKSRSLLFFTSSSQENDFMTLEAGLINDDVVALQFILFGKPSIKKCINKEIDPKGGGQFENLISL